ncbi:MAG: hypothetical protein GEU91_19150 [Rhizobiales bacterium]|nr:hypothetical protein [Hyphomicrobiales bacterium]
MAKHHTCMRRLLVVGSPGAGKTRLSGLLADKLGLPLIHLDYYRFNPHWVPVERQHWLSLTAEIAAGPQWIIDGTWEGSFPICMPRADTLIWLDLPRSTCLRRVMLRSLRNFGRLRPELNGCREFLPCVPQVWSYPAKQRPNIVHKIERFGRHLSVIRLRNDHETDAFIATLGDKPNRSPMSAVGDRSSTTRLGADMSHSPRWLRGNSFRLW